jgi:NADPH:quinone reductase-like Zn-dependent oxidoreductase
MSEETMQALVLTGYGGPDSTGVRAVPRPTAAPGQVLIHVHACGLNPVDYKTREGKLRVIRRYPLPCVMGNELAGVVVARGPGATRFEHGDRVMVRVPKETMGAFAEYAAVDERLCALVPGGLALDVAAGIPLAGLTALQCLRDALGVAAGQDVLITGGAGGVGTLAIQIAKQRGGRVTTTASPRGVALVKSLGADEVLDYTAGALERITGRFDATFDTVGGAGLAAALRATRRGGKLVTISGPVEPRTARIDLQRGVTLAALFWLVSAPIRRVARACGVDYRYLFMHASGEELAELAAMVEAGALRVVVDRVFPFEQIKDAMVYLESGRAKGKVIARVREEAAGDNRP